MSVEQKTFSIYDDILLRKSRTGEIEIHFYTMNMNDQNKDEIINRLEEAITFLKEKPLEQSGVVEEIRNLDEQVVAVGYTGKNKYHLANKNITTNYDKMRMVGGAIRKL